MNNILIDLEYDFIIDIIVASCTRWGKASMI